MDYRQLFQSLDHRQSFQSLMTMFYWSIITASAIAIFLIIWSFYAPVSTISRILITRDYMYQLPFSISRWWDILLGPIYSCIFICLLNHEEVDLETSFVGMIIGLGFSLGIDLYLGLKFGLAVVLITSLTGCLILGLFVGLRRCLDTVLDISLGISLGIGLSASLIFGLSIGLIVTLVTGLTGCFIFILELLFKRCFKVATDQR